jgi:dienelactone hydrolase
LLAAGCDSGGVDVDVTPRSMLADRPVHVTVTGLHPHARVTVELRSTDARQVTWSSAARFRADADGTVDLDRAASTSGSYASVWGMGLMTTLTPLRGVAAYAWDDARPLVFTVRVRSGKDVAQTTFRRRFSSGRLTRIRTTVAANGFAGEYIAPSGGGRHAAVLAFGGSEGGLFHVDLAERLAARGYPTLTIAYFGLPGLPRYLADIPLEYFANALRWLEGRPEVDRKSVFVLGISRGSEAALLLGLHYPRLVHGVVASVPSSVVNPGWMLDGRAVPFTLQFANPRPDDEPRAIIPVERIRGPVFLNCAENDAVWPSCAYAEALAARLKAHHRPYVLHESAAATHYAGNIAPYEISSFPGSRVDELARERLWPRLVAFLAGAS